MHRPGLLFLAGSFKLGHHRQGALDREGETHRIYTRLPGNAPSCPCGVADCPLYFRHPSVDLHLQVRRSVNCYMSVHSHDFQEDFI